MALLSARSKLFIGCEIGEIRLFLHYLAQLHYSIYIAYSLDWQSLQWIKSEFTAELQIDPDRTEWLDRADFAGKAFFIWWNSLYQIFIEFGLQ